MEAAIIVPSISAVIVALCRVVCVKMRLDVVREELRRTPDPSYSEVTDLAEKLRATAAPSRASTRILT